MALNHSSLGLFETGFRQQISVGQPPSLHKLMPTPCSAILTGHVLCLRHTLDFFPPFGAADHGHDGEKEDVRELVLHFPLLAWVTDDGEVLQEAESVHGDDLSLKRQHMITADIDRQSDPSPSRFFFKKCALRCIKWLLVFKFKTRRKPCQIRLFHDLSLVSELEMENDILKKWQRFQAEERRKSTDS